MSVARLCEFSSRPFFTPHLSRSRAIIFSFKRSMATKAAVDVPRPSASILLFSHSNEVLLLHRVQTSSAFPSAHVFPGGNISEKQDGEVPPADHPLRHEDGDAYRRAAIRECFEESGILLALKGSAGTSTQPLTLPESEMENARRAVHSEKLNFPNWVEEQGGTLDTSSLIPFTRWVTPRGIKKRFTTQMYIYFLPLSGTNTAGGLEAHKSLIPTPTSDGGVEHTAARFLPIAEWLRLAESGEIIMFPPQYFLLALLAPFFPQKPGAGAWSDDELKTQRSDASKFVNSGNPPWTDKCISPVHLGILEGDGRTILSLENPGPELRGSDRKGDSENAVLVEFHKGGPRRLKLVSRKSVAGREKRPGKL